MNADLTYREDWPLVTKEPVGFLYNQFATTQTGSSNSSEAVNKWHVIALHTIYRSNM
jgi:hypothetical protein